MYNVCATVNTATLFYYTLQFKHRFSANAIIRDAGVLFQLKVFRQFKRVREKLKLKNLIFHFNSFYIEFQMFIY